MDDQRLPTSLRGELDALGWSAEQLIARINQVRARRGSFPLHGKSAYPWLRGSRPCAEARADVLTVLRQHSHRPLTAADFGWDRLHRQEPRHALDTASPRVHQHLHSITAALRDYHGQHPRVRAVLSEIPR